MGAVLGTLQAPGLFVPTMALLAAPPSASSQLEHRWEASGHVAAPSFTAAVLASFLTKVAERKALILHPFVCTNSCLRDSVWV